MLEKLSKRLSFSSTGNNEWGDLATSYRWTGWTSKLHEYYTLTSMMSLPLLYPEILEIGCAQCKFPSLLSHFPLIYHGFWHYHNPAKNSNHTLAHITLSLLSWLQILTLCYSIMSHVTLILYYHASTFTTYLLNITCTLVAASLILMRLEYTHHSRRIYRIYLYM